MSPARLLVIPLLAATALAQKSDPFAEGVRPTEPLTAEEQAKTFHLPPGFSIQLFASEPQINKPINLAFDARGRLWVTSNVEYPFAVPLDRLDPQTGRTRGSRDRIVILEDTDGDGRADKTTTFADELNIPTGVLPYGRGCLAWSIPNLWYLEDTDGDSVCDRRSVLFGPLGWEKDTHGNISSYRRGADGWVYATHGFNNTSRFTARDGSTLELHSGNTFRFRPDGSRIEPHTWGQVNPFGLAWDARGNLFSADCHSSPIYQLLRGAHYPSFGKPHDGLGFAPVTIQHTHGSTAIDAPIYVHDPAWPAEYQNHMFIGNVMTSRLNHDVIEWHGASSKGRELPDFLKTDDPWFRPVDLQWGPDSALYVADFYNRIIGHYEVPLKHPGRDRERGRIWRIVPPGGAKKLAPLPTDAAGLVAELGSSNPTRRMLALHELCDQHGAGAAELLRKTLAAPSGAHQVVGALWALQRLGQIDEVALLAHLSHADALVRTHALRVADARREWSPSLASAVRARLQDEDAIAARVAAEALGAHPQAENFHPLVEKLRTVSAEDDHLRHSVRVALRDHLREASVAGTLALDGLTDADLRAVLGVMLAVPGEAAANLRLSLFEKITVPVELLTQQLPSLAKNLPAARLDTLAAIAREKLAGHLDAQASTAKGLLEALAARNAKPGENLRAWGTQLTQELLDAKREQTGWVFLSLEGTAAEKNPWAFQERPQADGTKAQLLSSHPRGEQLTGLLRSAPFAAPEKLHFYLAGHDGAPGRPPQGKNFVRLRDAATLAELRTASPPRSDTAQPIEWSLADLGGRRVFLEVADGDNAGAYAWLALGRFQPELPALALHEPTAHTSRLTLAATLARTLQLPALAPRLAEVFRERNNDAETRSEAAQALVALDPWGQEKLLDDALRDAQESEAVRANIARAFARTALPVLCGRVAEALSSAPFSLQHTFASALATTQPGTTALLEAIERGKATPTLLRDRATFDRLLASGTTADDARLRGLAAKLPSADSETEKLIAARKAGFAKTPGDTTRGQTVFAQNCAICHRLGGAGALVGPQLDGVGNRGLDRLLEDTLDPHRNVDHAFRLQTITKTDGSVQAGLFRREEGTLLVFADVSGQEFRVQKSEVRTREESPLSLMPPAGPLIPEPQYYDLLAYLLAQRGQP